MDPLGKLRSPAFVRLPKSARNGTATLLTRPTKTRRKTSRLDSSTV